MGSEMCIRDRSRPMSQPVRLMYPSVSDGVDELVPSPSPRFSLTHPRRRIGPHNATSPMTQPVRLMYPSVSDGENESVPSPSPRFSLTHTCKFLSFSFQSFITPTLIYIFYLHLSFYRFIINLKWLQKMEVCKFLSKEVTGSKIGPTISRNSHPYDSTGEIDVSKCI